MCLSAVLGFGVSVFSESRAGFGVASDEIKGEQNLEIVVEVFVKYLIPNNQFPGGIWSRLCLEVEVGPNLECDVGRGLGVLSKW